MKIITSLKQRLTSLLTTPLAELGSWARFIRGQIQLWRFCVRRLYQNNVMAMSAALSFRTIFAIVPALVVAFLVMKSLGVVEDSKRMLRDFLDRGGLSQITYVDRSAGTGNEDDPGPAVGPVVTPDGIDDDGKITVAEKVEAMVDRLEGQLTVGRLGPISIVLLVWTALTLLTTMERSLNRIFEAPRPRSLARRVLVYWSVLTLGPVLVVAASSVGSDLIEAVRNIPVLAWTLGPIGWVAPVIVGMLMLAGLYTLMPNTEVRFRVAAEGAVLAVPLWLLVKWAFSLYVDHVGRTSLYGALGLLPLFLLWLNISWWIFLFGAQVAHSAANLTRLMQAEQDGEIPLTPWHYLAAVLAVAQEQMARGKPIQAAQIAEPLALPTHRAETLLQRLTDEKILVRVAGGGPAQCVLATPPAKLAVARVLAAACPGGDRAFADSGDNTIARTVAEVRRRAQAGVEGLTVGALMEGRPQADTAREP